MIQPSTIWWVSTCENDLLPSGIHGTRVSAFIHDAISPSCPPVGGESPERGLFRVTGWFSDAIGIGLHERKKRTRTACRHNNP